MDKNNQIKKKSVSNKTGKLIHFDPNCFCYSGSFCSLSACFTHQLGSRCVTATQHFFLSGSFSEALLEEAVLFTIPIPTAQQLPWEQVAHAMQAYAKMKGLRDWGIPNLLGWLQLNWEMRIWSSVFKEISFMKQLCNSEKWKLWTHIFLLLFYCI